MLSPSRFPLPLLPSLSVSLPTAGSALSAPSIDPDIPDILDPTVLSPSFSLSPHTLCLDFVHLRVPYVLPRPPPLPCALWASAAPPTPLPRNPAPPVPLASPSLFSHTLLRIKPLIDLLSPSLSLSRYSLGPPGRAYGRSEPLSVPPPRPSASCYMEEKTIFGAAKSASACVSRLKIHCFKRQSAPPRLPRPV